jgi:MraZ protein
MVLPSDYRLELSKAGMVLTRGFDRNVMLLTRAAFEKLCACVRSISVTDPLGRTLARMLLGNAVEIKLDRDGIFSVPATLASPAGLEGEIVVLGQGEYLELWSLSAWKEQEVSLDAAWKDKQHFEKFNVSLA